MKHDCEMPMVDEADRVPTPGKRVDKNPDKNPYKVPVLDRGNGK